MMEPSDTLQENEGQDIVLNLVELFDENESKDESESEDASEDVDVGEELHDFLTLTIKGPQLDEKMVVLLFHNGVEDSVVLKTILPGNAFAHQYKQTTQSQSKHAE
jgi:hypothetical protein